MWSLLGEIQENIAWHYSDNGLLLNLARVYEILGSSYIKNNIFLKITKENFDITKNQPILEEYYNEIQ